MKFVKFHSMQAEVVFDGELKQTHLYSYDSHAVTVLDWFNDVRFKAGIWNYSTTTAKQISRFFAEYYPELPELASARGRRAAINRGYTTMINGNGWAIWTVVEDYD